MKALLRASHAAATLALCATPLSGAAQTTPDYPTQSVRIIVATSPGGALDATARAIGNKLQQMWGQQVIVDNRAGARKNPGKLLYGTGGQANISHLGWEWVCHLSGIKMKHVAYKGASNAVKATIAGELHVGFSTVHSLRGHFASGRAYPLAVTSKKRLAQLPEAPTVAEFGMPEYEINQWYGLVTSARVPPALVARISPSIIEAVKSPEVEQRLGADGSIPVGSTAAEFSAHMSTETTKWRKVLEATGLILSGAKLK